ADQGKNCSPEYSAGKHIGKYFPPALSERSGDNGTADRRKNYGGQKCHPDKPEGSPDLYRSPVPAGEQTFIFIEGIFDPGMDPASEDGSKKINAGHHSQAGQYGGL